MATCNQCNPASCCLSCCKEHRDRQRDGISQDQQHHKQQQQQAPPSSSLRLHVSGSGGHGPPSHQADPHPAPAVATPFLRMLRGSSGRSNDTRKHWRRTWRPC
ncbi:hypothetical protein J4Q44_G00252500 [Coregonus suidteri]|uniref:Uncharacterized protein n=1 Tax=Coregonus suidteri TaxID=861788 RepID=A0AAN8L9D8_9TELE